MRRPAPLGIKQKRNAYQGSQPLLPVNRSNQRRRAFDAATEFFKKYKSPLTDTLQDVFGTAFFARAALWLDPISKFRNTAGIYCYANRLREKPGFTHNGTIVNRTRIRNGQTYNLEAPTKLLPLQMQVVGEEEESVINDNATSWISFMRDSTRKSRDWDNSFTFNEAYSADPPSYGEMEMHNVKSETIADPNTVNGSDLIYSHRGPEGTFEYQQYILDEVTTVAFVDGSCTSVSGSIFVEDIEAYALKTMNDNVLSMISQASASKRVFNLAYQITELKDIPRLLGDIGALQRLVSKYVKNPLKLAELDKEISNLFLSWKFGAESAYSAFKGLMKLPEKATKRLNYLIRRNGKVSTGRSKHAFVEDMSDQELPTFEFILPSWITADNQEVTRTFSVELRCVVNQTIKFPELAVPSITDKDYLELVGAIPTAEDLYNVIPFSWLVDYFVGIGDYIGVLTAIHSDRELINFGFMTIVIVEELQHKATLKVSNRLRHSLDGVGVISDVTTVKEFPYLRKYTRKYQHRVSVGDLDGVKSVGFFQTNLSDFQLSILGSLFSQRA